MAVNIYAASAQELRTLEGVGEKKAARIIKLRETEEVTEENLAAEIQLPIETIQQWIRENKLSLLKIPMSLPTPKKIVVCLQTKRHLKCALVVWRPLFSSLDSQCRQLQRR